MINGIKTLYRHGLNEGLGSKFYVGSRVRHDIPKEEKEASAETLKMKTIARIFFVMKLS